MNETTPNSYPLDPTTLLRTAAHTMAAVFDRDGNGLNLEGAPLEARDALAGLKDDLEAAGYMEDFRREGGGFSIW